MRKVQVVELDKRSHRTIRVDGTKGRTVVVSPRSFPPPAEPQEHDASAPKKPLSPADAAELEMPA